MSTEIYQSRGWSPNFDDEGRKEVCASHENSVGNLFMSVEPG